MKPQWVWAVGSMAVVGILAVGRPGSTPRGSPSLRSAGTTQRPTTPGSWHIATISFRSAKDGVVAASNAHDVAIFQTTDGGTHWTRTGLWPFVPVSHTPNTVHELGAPLALAFANARDGLMEWYQEAAVGQMWVDIGRTTDGGRHWSLVATHLLLWDGSNALAMTDPTTAWLANGADIGPTGYVLRTTNGGTRWRRAATVVRLRALGSLATALRVTGPEQATLLTALPAPTPYHAVVVDQFTTDGGRQWRTVRVPTAGLNGFVIGSREQTAAYWSPTTQWVIATPKKGRARLFTYEPSQRRWIGLPIPTGNPQSLALVGAQTGYLAGTAHLWKTANGGRTWTALGPL